MIETNYLSDGHVHTKLCHHACGEMEEYVQAAVRKGLNHLVFLEHFEVGVSYFETTWLTEDDFRYYLKEGQRLQEKYQDRILVETGVEIGFNRGYNTEIQNLIHNNPWARVGLSYHYMPVLGEHHINMLSRQHTNIERMAQYGHGRMLTNYYQGLLEAVQVIDADVVCHLDAGLRNAKDVLYQDIHWQLVEQILDVMAQRNMALEINTSGLSLRGEPFPCKRMIEMAKLRRIQFVLGSDAHKPEQVGRGFEVIRGE